MLHTRAPAYGWLRLLLAGVFALPSALLAQDYLVTAQFLSTEDGLSDRYVRNVYQDSAGFVWLPSNYGVNRYDGYEFKTYFQQQHGLQTNGWNHVFQDRSGRYWLASFTKRSFRHEVARSYTIDLLDVWTDRAVPLAELNPPFSPEEVTFITTDRYRNIWLNVLPTKLYRYDGRRFKLIFDLPEGMAGSKTAVAPDGRIGILKHKQLYLLDSLGRLVERKTLARQASHLIAGPDGQFWLQQYRERASPTAHIWSVTVGKPIQPFRLTDATGTPGSLSYDQFSPPGSAIDRFGRWWIVVDGKLLLFASDGRLLLDISAALGGQRFPNQITITLDDNDLAWIGSTAGVYTVTVRKNPFKNYLISEQLTDTRDIVVDPTGTVYVNQLETLALDPVTGVTRSIGVDGRIAAFCGLDSLLYFGDYNNRVIQYDPRTQEAVSYWAEESFGADNHNPIFAIYQSLRDSIIWVGTGLRSLLYLDREAGSLRPFLQYNAFTTLVKSSVLTFHENDAGIWLGTTEGIFLLDAERGIVDHFDRRQGDLPHDYISHIHEDAEGIFWLATKGGGLVRWDRKQERYRQYTRADGLSHNVIYAVYEDDWQNLWLSSNAGLMRFSKSTGWVTTYFPKDGLLHEEFNLTSHGRAPDGRLYFGGLRGVSSFYPRELLQNDSLPGERLSISAYAQWSKTEGRLADQTAELLAERAIRLLPGSRSFSLKVALTDYSNPQQNRFAYRVAGLEKDWHYQYANDIRVNGLPYGRYVLEVRGQGTDGRWSVNTLRIPLHSVKPFYQRWWFLLVGLALTGLLYWLREHRLRADKLRLEAEVADRTAKIRNDAELIARQAAELRKLDELKTRFYTNVSHELRTPLTLLLGPVEKIIKRNRLENRDFTLLRLVRQNAQQLRRLVDELLDLSKIEAGKLDLYESIVPVYPVLRRLVHSFASHAQDKKIQLSLDNRINGDLQIRLDAEKFEKIVINLLANALKFTPAQGEVRIVLQETPDQVRLHINDTGPGIHPDDLPYIFDRFYQAKYAGTAPLGGTGVGLSLSREYARLLGGSLTAHSSPGEGSEFILEIPKREVLGGEERPATSEVPWPARPKISENSAFGPSTVRDDQPEILIVEDNRNMTEYLRLVLMEEYRVRTVENGRAALAALQTYLPDLIVSDVMMPVMDGFALLKTLRDDDRYRRIPFILVTARAEKADRLRALRIGVDDYIVKPFEEDELRARVNNALRNLLHRRSAFTSTEKASGPSAALPAAAEVELSKADIQWLEELEQLIRERCKDFHFTLEVIGKEMSLSPRQLRRRIKKLTGCPPSGYILEIRLTEARRLLEEKRVDSVKAAALSVGLKDVKNFSQQFHKRFGRRPSTYLT